MRSSSAQAPRPIVGERMAIDEPESLPDIGRIYAIAAAPSDAEIRHVLRVSGPTDDVLCRLPTDD
jgi:hypothetical protein